MVILLINGWDVSRIEKLLKQQFFKTAVKKHLGADLSGLDSRDLESDGLSKRKLLVLENKETGRAGILKEIMYTEDHSNPHQNLTLSRSQGLIELRVIKETEKVESADKKHFPPNFGTWIYREDQGKFEKEEKLDAESVEEIDEASFFIFEEFISGEPPNEEELKHAQQIRRDGMKRSPKIWATADDEHPDDIIITEDGTPIFIDRGNFNRQDVVEEENIKQERFLFRMFLGATNEYFNNSYDKTLSFGDDEELYPDVDDEPDPLDFDLFR